jgi:lipopolysaccharide transport system ATP-binding protein
LSQPAIRVHKLSKEYRLAHNYQRGRTFREMLMDVAKVPFHRLRGAPTRSTEIFSALQDVSFEVQPGEVMGVIGRNGAGKSTLLKILSRITEPTSGRAELRGRVASLLEVGTGFHPELTGRENIFLNGALLGMSRAEVNRKFDAIVAFSEVEKFLDTPVKHYSSGMYVRLAFAVAAHLETEILLVDEVLAVGDAAFQRKCLGKVKEMTGQARTVLFVSHNETAVRLLSSCALVLDQGKTVFWGDIEEAYKIYNRSGGQFKGVVTWQNRDRSVSGEKLTIHSITIQGNETSIHTDGPIEVKIRFSVLEEGSMVGFTLLLHTHSGVQVFSSINNHDAVFEKPLARGIYESHAVIPAFLLNVGTYYLSLRVLSEGYRLRFDLPEILAFEVSDGGSLRRGYLGEWRGVVRPMLKWSTGRVNTTEGEDSSVPVPREEPRLA